MHIHSWVPLHEGVLCILVAWVVVAFSAGDILLRNHRRYSRWVELEL